MNQCGYANSTCNLPFTGGSDFWLLVGIGLVILMAGVAMAWVARRG